MQTDRYGNALSTTSDAACRAYVEGVDHILGATFGAVQALERAVGADPGFALAHAALGRARMYAGDMRGAQAAIETAQGLSPATGRESGHIHVLDLLFRGQAAAARAAVHAHVADYPRDALIAQINASVFGLIGFSGAPGREADLLAYTSALAPHYTDDWWFDGIHATSLCEVGKTDAALALMEKSLAANPRNANAAHFKAHILYEAGRPQAGLDYLSDWLPGYDRRGLMHGHLSWHRALWTMATGNAADLEAVLDADIGPGGSLGLPINTLTDTVSLLFRAEVAGIPVTDGRWSSLSDYAAQTFPQPGQSFADLHAALAHAKAGQGARLAPYLDADTGYAAAHVRAAARAFRAMADCAWEASLDPLTEALADHARLGGSRAQRDLLEFAYLHVLVQSGRPADARRWIAIRRPRLANDAPIAGLH